MYNNEQKSETIIKRFEEAGYRAAFLPYAAIRRINRAYGEITEKNGVQYILNAAEHFKNNQPPDIPFAPASFLITAQPGDRAEFILNTDGGRRAIPVPPPFITPAEKKRFDNVVDSATSEIQTAHTRGISQKLLVALSGLGKYGRNNICYINGLGSYFNVRAFYTDVLYKGDIHPLTFLDECESCGICEKNCVTGALSDSAIDAAKCISLYNENDGEIPDWIPITAHATMISCSRCQEGCPANGPLSLKKHTLELDEDETRTLLACPASELPIELKNKLSEFGADERFISVAGRNARLALKNLQ